MNEETVEARSKLTRTRHEAEWHDRERPDQRDGHLSGPRDEQVERANDHRDDGRQYDAGGETLNSLTPGRRRARVADVHGRQRGEDR